MDYKTNTPSETIYRWINKYRLTRCLHQPALRIIGGLKRDIDHHRHTFSFLKAVIKNPRVTGAVLPSSKRLARVMTDYIHCVDNSLVVELGAGTGVITQAIIDRGIPPEQIIAVEYSAPLAKKLRQRFPRITVLQGNAAHLAELLRDRAQPVSTIISGLPLRSLPIALKDDILFAISQVLSPEGRYIQFTYDIRNHKNSFYPEYYTLDDSEIVWRNIPPARVEVHTLEISLP